jgi:hypothetical protein
VTYFRSTGEAIIGSHFYVNTEVGDLETSRAMLRRHWAMCAKDFPVRNHSDWRELCKDSEGHDGRCRPERIDIGLELALPNPKGPSLCSTSTESLTPPVIDVSTTA